MERTHASVERALRARLVHPGTSIRFAKLKVNQGCARVDYGPDGFPEITVDPYRCAVIDGVLHELLHVCFNSDLAKWGKLEEAPVEALEDQLVRYVNRNSKRVEWWRKAIASKAEE